MDTMHVIAAFAAGTAFGIGATQVARASTPARIVGGLCAALALAVGAVLTFGAPSASTTRRQVVSIAVPPPSPRSDIPAPARPTRPTAVERSDR